ncbi:ribonuclease HepT family protein [Haloferax larsenii]|uniref:hypothetical protein n=1 Tax=Haloferax larsenii TaxID=302484 RepID=UPI000A57CED4|nr:hypothetical protein [Haloferax larsenii]
MADERVVSIKLEQIEQSHGELREKQETLSRREFLQSTTEQRAVERMFETLSKRVLTLLSTSPLVISGTPVGV